jgi:YVTN family beta-propeller protein
LNQNFPLAVVSSGPAVLSVQPLSGGAPTTTLKLPGTPNSVIVTPDGKKAFLLDTNHGQVVPVDLASLKVGTPISVGKLPTDEHLSQDGTTLYVTDNLGGAVIPIDTATNRPRAAQSISQGIDFYDPAPSGGGVVLGVASPQGEPGNIYFYKAQSGLGPPIAVGNNTVSDVQITPDVATVWVVEAGLGSKNGSAIPVNAHTRAVGSAVPLGHGVAGDAMSPDGHWLVVANSLDATVSVVDLTRQAVVATVPVGASPASVTISSDSATAWVGCSLGRTLVPVNLKTGTAGAPVQLANSPTVTAIPAGSSNALILFPSSDGNVSFLSNNTTLGQPLALGNDPRMLISQDGKTGWVANALSDTVERLDISKQTTSAPIKVPRTPSEIRLSRDTRTLYVLSYGDGTGTGYLTKIDTTTLKAQPSIAVGVSPDSLILTPDENTAFISIPQSNSITTVDLKRWRIGHSISTSCSPSQLVSTPDSKTVFADCYSDGLIVPIKVDGDVRENPIQVGPNPALSLSHNGKLLFVGVTHGLFNIDTATDKIINVKEETGNFGAVYATPNDQSVIAVDDSGAALVIIDPRSLETLKSLSVGSRPYGFQLSPNGAVAYVLDTSQQQMYLVNLSTVKVIGSVSLPVRAEDIVTPLQPY